MRRIKRGNYSGIYSSRRRRRSSSALKTVIFIILAAAVVFVGYSISDPLIRLFSGNLKPTAASHISSSKSTASSSKKASSSKAGSSSKLKAAAVRGVYLPKSYLSNTAELNSFISQAKSAGINLAVIDLKAEDGVVNYASKTDSAKEAMAQGAPDASAAAKALSDAGITPAARICAFQDPVAPSVLRGAGVLYSQNHSMNWLDPSGNRWLNPNSQQAQQYITSLATEAVSLGYKQIFIDSLTFPTKGNPDSQGYYGDNMTSKEQVISDYVKTLKQQVNAAGGKLTVMAAGAAAVGQANEN
ncbi:MAG TPA: putative glycoside hydrolase, partial [Ruminiclostridium sp.]|nr:putative glycoside hydrolase [Ruminiclostridium sp.]